MSTPSVGITKTDGNLAVAASTDRILAIIGPAKSGTVNAAFPATNKTDVIDEFQEGILVEAAAYAIARGIPVVCIRADATTAGAYGAVDESGITGTATVTAGATQPTGDFDVIVKVITGGALGTAGIEYQTSHDNGVNWSPTKSLGTSLSLDAGHGVSFTLAAAASTLVAGDTFKVTTTGPKSTSADLTPAYDALFNYTGEWLRALVLSEADSTLLVQGDTFAQSFHAFGKYPEVIMNVRPRGIAETRAAYQTALGTIIAAVQSLEISPCADQIEIVSEVTGWRLRMPLSIPYAARLMVIDDSIDAAAKALGALPGVFVKSYDGTREYHDELRFPGLDALGFTTARTYRGRPMTPGVFINNPRLPSGAGSDYRYFQHTAIINRIIESAFSLLEPKLSIDVLADASTGLIREDVASSIEEAINAELRTIYADPGRCSGVQFALSRTDNILSTDTLTFSVGAVPKGYVKKFIGKVGLVRSLSK